MPVGEDLHVNPRLVMEGALSIYLQWDDGGAPGVREWGSGIPQGTGCWLRRGLEIQAGWQKVLRGLEGHRN